MFAPMRAARLLVALSSLMRAARLALGVSLGFCQGNRMANEEGVLQAEGRKQVYVKYFHSLNEIQEDKVRALLFEAAMIDDAFGERKKVDKKVK